MYRTDAAQMEFLINPRLLKDLSLRALGECQASAFILGLCLILTALIDAALECGQSKNYGSQILYSFNIATHHVLQMTGTANFTYVSS